MSSMSLTPLSPVSLSPMPPMSPCLQCPQCPHCPQCPLSSPGSVPSVPSLPSGLSPAVPKAWQDPSVSPGPCPPLPAVSPAWGQACGATSAARAFPHCVPNNGSATCRGPCPLPGDSGTHTGTAGQTRGQQDTGTGAHGPVAPWLLTAGCRWGGLCAVPPGWHCWWPPRPPRSGHSAGHRGARPAWGCGTAASGDSATRMPPPQLSWRPPGRCCCSRWWPRPRGSSWGCPWGPGGARRERERAAGATLLLAGLLSLLGLGLGSGGALALLGPPRSSWSFSWSFILAWVAAALLASAGIFHICSASKDPSPESSEVGGS
ncbi:uncharacterized protein LOC141725698 [Zonotrichia albicollis]|uniref:uncharacterized protein LOC141725698 n=1 Tax=Zonotrichia albicollis TaxID=44394 RepID=UPI003D810753